jgi:hypothetical protein
MLNLQQTRILSSKLDQLFPKIRYNDKTRALKIENSQISLPKPAPKVIFSKNYLSR